MSCGGNLLVNIGPDSAGQIAPVFQERLQQLGAWLAWHGEAIYSSQPWAAQQDSANKQVGVRPDKSGTKILCLLHRCGTRRGGRTPARRPPPCSPSCWPGQPHRCRLSCNCTAPLLLFPGVGAGQPGGRPPHPGAAAGRGGAPTLGGAAGWGTDGLPPPHQTRPRPCLGSQV